MQKDSKNKKKCGNFDNVNFILDYLDLKPSAKVLLLTLDRLAFNSEEPDKSWWPTMALMKKCRVNERTFFNDRFVLEYTGLIEVGKKKEGKGRFDSNCYRVCREKFKMENVARLNVLIKESVTKRKFVKILNKLENQDKIISELNKGIQ